MWDWLLERFSVFLSGPAHLRRLLALCQWFWAQSNCSDGRIKRLFKTFNLLLIFLLLWEKWDLSSWHWNCFRLLIKRSHIWPHMPSSSHTDSQSKNITNSWQGSNPLILPSPFQRNKLPLPRLLAKQYYSVRFRNSYDEKIQAPCKSIKPLKSSFFFPLKFFHIFLTSSTLLYCWWSSRQHPSLRW